MNPERGTPAGARGQEEDSPRFELTREFEGLLLEIKLAQEDVASAQADLAEARRRLAEFERKNTEALLGLGIKRTRRS